MIKLEKNGLFFHGYDKSAKALNLLMGYQVTEEQGRLRAGLPAKSSSTIEKLIDVCEEKHVSYQIYDGIELLKEYIFDDDATEEIIKDFDETVVKKYDPKQFKDKQKHSQRTAILSASGINPLDALNGIEKQLSGILDGGGRITSFSLVHLDAGHIGGVCVYETGKKPTANKEKPPEKNYRKDRQVTINLT